MATSTLQLGLQGAFYRYEEPWWPSDNFEGFAFVHKNPTNYTEAEAARDWTRSSLGLYAISHREKTSI